MVGTTPFQRSGRFSVGIGKRLLSWIHAHRDFIQGVFDPLTNGHLDVIERAAKLFDQVIVAIATNTAKPLFTSAQRRELVSASVKLLKTSRSIVRRVVVEYVGGVGPAIVRGRAPFRILNLEFQLALMTVSSTNESRPSS